MNEITLSFASAVASTGAIKLEVKKGAATTEIASTKWADDNQSVVLTTVANMTNGTYTVTATQGEETASKTFDVESQKVAEILIKNEVALTGSRNIGGTETDSAEAYIYYDVVDQYGSSIRTSTTIEWSSSVKVDKVDKSAGKLTVIRTDDKAFTYGEQIYITGVYNKTGVAKNATVTVGTKQSLNEVEIAGFVKTGTSDILKSLPAGFKSGEYYILYSVKDQNDNDMTASGDYISGKSEVTFVSNNVLVIKEISGTGEKVITVKGVEYNAAPVVPGTNVDKGGEVTITAIANKTGNKKDELVVVGNSQILKSFTLGAPEGVVADGETATIPFTALDQNGEKITSFVTLASQSDFSRLSLNASEGTIKLAEQNDGTAKLTWSDSKTAWAADSEDGIDRPISLTSVVVGGETSNEMIYVSDKAMPVAIKSVDMNSVYVEGDVENFGVTSSFIYLDQYGRTMGDYGDDNGFFAASKAGTIKGTEFTNYVYGIKAEYKGSASVVTSTGIANGLDAGANKEIHMTTDAGSGAAIKTEWNCVSAASADQTVTFAIERYNTSKNAFDSVSPVKTETFKVIDISKVASPKIDAIDKVYVNTAFSSCETGELAGFESDSMGSAVTDAAIQAAYAPTVTVKGTYNGVSVDVPSDYIAITGTKIGTDLEVDGKTVTEGGLGVVTIMTASGISSQFKISDLYDAKTAKYLRKDTTDLIKATIYAYNPAVGSVDKTDVVDTATTTVTISDEEPYAATIVAKDAYTYTPNTTVIASALDPKTQVNDTAYCVKDQYNKPFAVTENFKISAIKENARYAENNFTVLNNDTHTASVKGAELGDTFTLTISVNNGKLTKDIAITVGADTQANITGATNNYLDTLVAADSSKPAYANGLEKQRVDALGNN